MKLSRTALPLSALLVAGALALSSCASSGQTHPGDHADPASPTPGAGASAQPGGDDSATGAPSPDTDGEPGTQPGDTTSGTDTPAPERVDCTQEKCVALTFDDGPGKDTDKVLDVLEANSARATFFLVGTRIERQPATVQREARLGMEIGNHTWDHPDLTKLSPAAQLKELDRVDSRVKELTGLTPTFMRPPGGALTKAEKVALKRPIADWSVDTRDWRTRNTASTIKAASAAKPGEIVLMHDIHASTVDAVGEIVKNLQSKGYRLVTLTELIGDRPTLGIAYGWGHTPAH